MARPTSNSITRTIRAACGPAVMVLFLASVCAAACGQKPAFPNPPQDSQAKQSDQPSVKEENNQLQIHGEISLDLRSRAGFEGRPQSGLYSGSIRTITNLQKDLTVELFGWRKSSYLNASSSEFRFQQATIEKATGLNRLQAGLIRIPFGIYDYRETYASGLIDYAMPRVDFGNNAVDWGAPGAKLTTSHKNLQIEIAGFEGAGAGVWSNINHLSGGAIRAQEYVKDLIVGISRWDGS